MSINIASSGKNWSKIKRICSFTSSWSFTYNQLSNIQIRQSYKVQAIQTLNKIFFRVFLHHLIERELLITKIYFLALANASFRSKNTQYSKVVVFEKNTSFSKCTTFCTLFIFSASENNFSRFSIENWIQASF